MTPAAPGSAAATLEDLARERSRKAEREIFAAALRHPEFSHIERIVQQCVPMLVAYRQDPASSAGRGYLASIAANVWDCSLSRAEVLAIADRAVEDAADLFFADPDGAAAEATVADRHYALAASLASRPASRRPR